MAVNSAFHTSNVTALATEQNLYRDLVIESIQIHGHDVFYLDRTLVNEDTILTYKEIFNELYFWSSF